MALTLPVLELAALRRRWHRNPGWNESTRAAPNASLGLRLDMAILYIIDSQNGLEHL
jgi:hypothetical protein